METDGFHMLRYKLGKFVGEVVEHGKEATFELRRCCSATLGIVLEATMDTVGVEMTSPGALPPSSAVPCRSVCSRPSSCPWLSSGFATLSHRRHMCSVRGILLAASIRA